MNKFHLRVIDFPKFRPILGNSGPSQEKTTEAIVMKLIPHIATINTYHILNFRADRTSRTETERPKV